MPIEIKELHIKINVGDESGRQESNNQDSNQKEEIIEACVEQIMEILSKKEER
jgi:hypothetical protein